MTKTIEIEEMMTNEITKDVCNIDIDRLRICFVLNGKMWSRKYTINQSPVRTLAKLGGYYYYTKD